MWPIMPLCLKPVNSMIADKSNQIKETKMSKSNHEQAEDLIYKIYESSETDLAEAHTQLCGLRDEINRLLDLLFALETKEK